MAAQDLKTMVKGKGGQKPAGARRDKNTVAAEVRLDPKTPIPFELGGHSFNVVFNSQYIPFLHGKNNFPQVLAEAAMLSPSQQACITTKTNFCIGEGFTPLNIKAGLDTVPELKTWLAGCNAKRQSFVHVARRYFGSFFKFGNVPAEIVCGQVRGKRFIYVYVKNLLDCRLGQQNPDTQEPEAMVVSKSFRRNGVISLAKDDNKVIPLYRRGGFKNKKYWKIEGTTQRTALWVKNPMEGYDDYGMPSSIGSLIFQLLEYGGARYNLDNLDNNMVPSGAIVLSGNIDKTEAEKLGRQIVHQHTGAGKRGRIAVFSSNQGIQDSKFLKFDTQTEGSYDKMDERAQSKIIWANEWDAILAGLQNPGAMGKGAGYLEEIYNQKLKTVIRPAQNTFLEDFLAPILEIADEWLGSDWQSAGLDFLPAQIMNRSTELTTTAAGLEGFLKIVELVANGIYSLDAAITLVADRFGITKEQATAQLGKINVRKDTTPPPDPNNLPGGN